MKLGMLAGAAAVAALIATPAMAQQQKYTGVQHEAADSIGAKKKLKMHRGHLNERSALAREDRLEDRRGSGFWPADVAAGVAGGAIGTAGAIAAAPFTPFRGDSYAYYRDSASGRGYIADANGPKCLPGQVTTINGQKMICQ